mmetsp:Transcript_14976/g.41943  ORF Transcript_14976/g.41943 Transcript_14976/m.41943 type:complete len:133 (+) Transcript_14976:560-958(+)
MGGNEKVYGGKGMTLHFTCSNAECDGPSVHLRLGSMVRLQRAPNPNRKNEVDEDADGEEAGTDDDGEQEEEPRCAGSFSKESTLAVLGARMGGQQFRACESVCVNLPASRSTSNSVVFNICIQGNRISRSNS